MVSCKCNWHCQYCAVNNSHDRKDYLSDETIIANANKVEPRSIVTIFGGEPGLTKRELLEKCIEILEAKECQIYLETNGLFIQKYPDLLNHFYEILYHCSEDLEPNGQILEFKHSRIRYLLIIHDKNIHKLQLFLNSHPNIQFDMLEATYPYPEEMDGPRLSKENKQMLIKQFSMKMTSESLFRLLNGKDFERIEFLDG